MRRAASRVLGPDAYAAPWTNEQTFAICRDCGFNAYALARGGVADFAAAAVCTKGCIAIYYNSALCVDMVRVYVLGELAVALAMQGRSQQRVECPERLAAVGAAMREHVGQSVTLMGQFAGTEGAAARLPA